MKYIYNPGDLQDVVVTENRTEAFRSHRANALSTLYCVNSNGRLKKWHEDLGKWYAAPKYSTPIKVRNAAKGEEPKYHVVNEGWSLCMRGATLYMSPTPEGRIELSKSAAEELAAELTRLDKGLQYTAKPAR